MAGHPRFKSLDDALWSRVEKREPDECWPWTAAVASHGYGNFRFRGKVLLAHAVAYHVANGLLNLGWHGGHVLHSCDNKRCCNPAHLRLGTPKDNAKDARGRNRVPVLRGEDAPRAKLTVADVRAIRAERGNVSYGAEYHVALAARYGVHPDTIHSIWSGRTWRSVPCQ